MIFKILALLVAQYIDNVSTQHALQYPGVYETNPVMAPAQGYGSFALRGAVIDTAVILATNHNKKLSDAAISAMIAGALVSANHNNERTEEKWSK